MIGTSGGFLWTR